MKLNENLITEAIIVGIMNIVVAIFFCRLFGGFNCYKGKTITILFLTGFTIHLLCEFLGLNKWYCFHGNACKKI